MRKVLTFFIALNILMQYIYKVQGMENGVIEALIVDLEGNVVPDSRIYIYLTDASDFRGPAKYVSEKADSNGKTFINLPKGTYFVTARKRINEENTGPLNEGDLYGRFDSNPLELKDGETKKIKIGMEKIEGKLLFSPVSSSYNLTITGILKNSDGSPVKNAYVLVYHSRELTGKPDYLSRPSDSQGKFVVHISNTGRYFLVARAKYGFPPRLGELYGEYNQEGIELNNNEKTPDIEIVLKPFNIDIEKQNSNIKNQIPK